MAIVAGGDAAPVFQPAEHAFDDISTFVSLVVERIGRPSRGCRWNDGFDLSLGEPFA